MDALERSRSILENQPMNPRFHPLLYQPNTCDFHRSCCHRILYFGGRVASPWCCIRLAILLCIKNSLEVSPEIPLDVWFCKVPRPLKVRQDETEFNVPRLSLVRFPR